MKREIPRDQWSDFLTAFAMQHDRWLVTVNIQQDGSVVARAVDEPLEGIIGRTGGSTAEVVIAVGANTRDHTRIVVEEASAITVEAEDGVDQSVAIEDVSGAITTVVLRTPVRPELVDGMP